MRLGLCGEPLKDGHSLGHSQPGAFLEGRLTMLRRPRGAFKGPKPSKY